MGRRYWLMKSEPSSFSFNDLLNLPQKTDHWDGVRNYQARNMMQEMKKGDRVLFYHSSTAPPHVVGIAEIAREAYPDHSAFDVNSKYHDPKSSPGNPRWFMVDVRAIEKLLVTVPLADLKANPKLAKMLVVQRGQRLSVQPVTPAEYTEVLRMAGASGH